MQRTIEDPPGRMPPAHATLGRSDFDLPPEERLQALGHRAYVGGDTADAWYGIGRRQYHFLVANGLESSHTFLDLACGALRLGQFLIPMLEPGRYFGVERMPSLVEEGLRHELLYRIAEIKQPRFIFSETFELETCDPYDYAIAQSLFTHLNLADIRTCFGALYNKARPGGKFYFTFFEGDEGDNMYADSHPHRNWQYRFETLARIAREFGWDATCIGDWGHERGQQMACVVRPVDRNPDPC